MFSPEEDAESDRDKGKETSNTTSHSSCSTQDKEGWVATVFEDFFLSGSCKNLILRLPTNGKEIAVLFVPVQDHLSAMSKNEMATMRSIIFTPLKIFFSRHFLLSYPYYYYLFSVTIHTLGIKYSTFYLYIFLPTYSFHRCNELATFSFSSFTSMLNLNRKNSDYMD